MIGPLGLGGTSTSAPTSKIAGGDESDEDDVEASTVPVVPMLVPLMLVSGASLVLEGSGPVGPDEEPSDSARGLLPHAMVSMNDPSTASRTQAMGRP